MNYSRILTLAICSNHRPKDMKIKSIGGVSKNVRGDVFCSKAIAAIITAREYK